MWSYFLLNNLLYCILWPQISAPQGEYEHYYDFNIYIYIYTYSLSTIHRNFANCMIASLSCHLPRLIEHAIVKKMHLCGWYMQGLKRDISKLQNGGHNIPRDRVIKEDQTRTLYVLCERQTRATHSHPTATVGTSGVRVAFRHPRRGSWTGRCLLPPEGENHTKGSMLISERGKLFI
jgi:hypothetical protein